MQPFKKKRNRPKFKVRKTPTFIFYLERDPAFQVGCQPLALLPTQPIPYDRGELGNTVPQKLPRLFGFIKHFGNFHLFGIRVKK